MKNKMTHFRISNKKDEDISPNNMWNNDNDSFENFRQWKRLKNTMTKIL